MNKEKRARNPDGGKLADLRQNRKAAEGNPEDISRCIGCLQGCRDKARWPKAHITCLLNPAVGKEKEYEISRAEKAKRVMVVGGGPAGLEAAKVAALSFVRLVIIILEQPLSLAALTTSWPASPAPITSIWQLSRLPTTSVARSSAIELMERAFRLIPVS